MVHHFCYLWVVGYTSALKTYSHCIYWFDSQSQDKCGLNVLCGTSVLLKFINLKARIYYEIFLPEHFMKYSFRDI